MINWFKKSLSAKTDNEKVEAEIGMHLQGQLDMVNKTDEEFIDELRKYVSLWYKFNKDKLTLDESEINESISNYYYNVVSDEDLFSRRNKTSDMARLLVGNGIGT